MSDLFELFSSLGDEINLLFHQTAQQWTKDLIDMVDPKIIICEGKMVFNNVQQIYNIPPIWNENIGYFELANKTFVLGYKRRYSYVQDKDGWMDFFKNELISRLSSIVNRPQQSGVRQNH